VVIVKEKTNDTPQQKGSSRFPGAGSLDFQEEVFLVPETIRHPLYHLDAVASPLSVGWCARSHSTRESANKYPKNKK